ncbi:hypothetical protein IAU60_000383 [Kwoniella sp. DSM 27419]
MSSVPQSEPSVVQPTPPAPAEPTPPPPPPSQSPAPPPTIFKPLLDPLQSEVTPSVSTIVEPPRSPNPANPAVNGVSDDATTAPVADAGRSPLPPDATVPPTPTAADEPPPSLPPSAIPSAVPTPTVISTEEQERKGGILVDATPAPLTPAPAVSGSAPSTTDEAMDIDAAGEEDVPAPASSIQPSTSEGSLKRTGEQLQGDRDEKRPREEASSVPSPAVAPPASTPGPDASVSTPAPSANGTAGAAPAPTPAWLLYEPTPPRPSGPTTPLTQHQHKHLLNAVRALKKKPDAGPFLAPVDVVAFGIPHYPQIIDSPMDISTVETKLIVSDPRGPPKDKSKMKNWDTSKGSYQNWSQVVEDVRRIWENSRKFNGKDHVVSQAADRADAAFEASLSKIPAEPPAVTTPTTPVPAAGPSTARRASVSQPPTIRRSSDDSRPKREIHPPPSKDLAYEEIPGVRKPKRRNDPQLQWAGRVVKSLESNSKYFNAVSPFLYPIEKIVESIPEYTSVVKQPIDLHHIKARLADGVYEDVAQVNDDVKLMVNNALKFNPPADQVHVAAKQLAQIWEEKWKTLPPKQEESRESSEDPLADDYAEDGYSSGEDNTQLRSLESQVSALNDQIAALRAKIAKRRANRPAKGSKSKGPKAGPSRKQSTAKYSPGANGNGHGAPKKAKKSSQTQQFRDEDDDMDSEDEPTTTMTLTQKQELAEKIQLADADVLQKAITIIQQTTNLGANNEEIELDIDSLPTSTVIKLYNLVCRGGRAGKRAKQGGPGGAGSAKKAGRKAMGGVSRKSVNEKEEAERIRRMEAQLQSFDSRGNAVGTYEGEESSSEEESSEEE